jgi:ParB family chromosome partitioning protein
MNSFYFWDEMAAKCLKSERYQEAIQSYRHALEATDDNASQASVWANIGNIFLTIQDIPAAVDAFLSASRLDPTSYDFDCILERITANGYLDEKAMLMAKDMYTLESVKTAQESEAVLEESLDEVFAAEPETEQTTDGTEIRIGEESVFDVVATETPAQAEAAEPVEPVAANEVTQPVADVVSAEETPDEAIISVSEIAPTLEPIFEETTPEPEVAPTSEPVAEEPKTESEAAPEPEPVKPYMLIPVSEIVENPLHLRVEMKSDELVESVRQFGILQPLVVTRMDDGKYMVVTGNRRLEAARLAGLECVPAVVRTATEREFLELALIENIQRVNLDPLELAEAYHLLIENFGLSADLIAASIGKSASIVMAAIDLLKLTEEGKQALMERSISEGHARALVEIDLPALQNNALVYVLENRLGVRQTEDLVRIILNAVAVSRSYDESYRNVVTDETEKRNSTDTCSIAEQKEVEISVETNAVAEISESEPAAEPEVAQDEPAAVEAPIEEAPALETNIVTETSESEPVVVAEAAPVEAPAEPEVVQTVAEDATPAVEPENVEAPIAVAVEAAPAVEQPTPVMVTDDQLMDMLVAECEQAEAHVEEGASAADASVDFSWLESAAAEADAQAPAEEIHAPASVEFSVDELLEKTTSAVASIESVTTVNGDVAQTGAVQTDVAIEPVAEKVEENLTDVIEEIVQFTPTADQAPAEEPAEPALAEAESVVSKEAEEAESRAPLKGLEAIAVYRRVVENNPTNVRIWHLLGNLYSEMGQYEEAIDCMKRTVDLDPGKYTYFYHLGLTLAIARRYPEAIQALEKTVELAPQHILAHCSLAGCYRRTGNAAESEKHLEIARPKLDQEKAYNRACFASISGDVDQAIELLQIAMSTDKTPAEWLLRDPDLDFIRDDPRFEAMIAGLDIPVREA